MEEGGAPTLSIYDLHDITPGNGCGGVRCRKVKTREEEARHSLSFHQEVLETSFLCFPERRDPVYTPTGVPSA